MNHQDGGTEQVIRCMLAMQRHPWEQGVCMQALYEADRPELWLPMAYDAVKRMSEDGRLAMVGGGAAVSDPAACGEVCLLLPDRRGADARLPHAPGAPDRRRNHLPQRDQL